ncbi:MAG: type II toxin-antitoxin system RelE/ParE family toxin [Syntrophobacteraceae bacterium]
MSGLLEIRYLPTADEDLENIFDYIMRDNPAAAVSMLDKFDEAISRMARNPHLGVVPGDDRLRKLGYRMLVIEDYLVFYVVKARVVQIRRILHGARDYRFLL